MRINLQMFHIFLLLLINKSLSNSTTSSQQVQSTLLNSQTSSETTSQDENSSQTFSSDSSTKSSTYYTSMFSYINPFKKLNVETSTESQPITEKLISSSDFWLSESSTISLFEKITETLRMIQILNSTDLNSFDSSSTSEMTSFDPKGTTNTFTTSDETFTKNFDQIEQKCNECVKNCYKNNFCSFDATSSDEDQSTTKMDFKSSTTEDFGSSLHEESTTISSSQSSDFSTSTDEILTTSESIKTSCHKSYLDEFIKVTKDLHELKVKYNLIAHELSLEKRRRKEAEKNLKIVTDEIKVKSEETKICNQKLENFTINFNLLANLIDIERLKVGLAQKINEFNLTDEIKTSNLTTMKFLVFELETEDSQVTLVSNQNLITLPSRIVEIAPKLSEFSASNCGIEFIVKSSFEELENLKVLNFSRNLITKIENKTFEELKNLEILDFSFNLIEKLEILSFHGLEELLELNLSSNKISSLPIKIFENLIKLKILNLSQNLINELKIEIFPSKIFIIEFYVDNNLLILIDSNLIIELENAAIIDMSSNLCIDAKFPEKSLLELGINLTKNCSNFGENEDESFAEF